MSVEVCAGIRQIREALSSARAGGRTIGLVPTMGALHEGHARLFRESRNECDAVVASIFVNPTQFDRQDDFQLYPRTFERDLALCRECGVNYVFSPLADEMYPSGHEAVVDPGRVAEHLCGRYRPGHFRGVATVVLQLLNIVQPEKAYFGEKDYQQLALIRRIVADLHLPVTIRAVETVRAADGLALSSRNSHLNAGERAVAPALYRALLEGRAKVQHGESDPTEIKNAVRHIIEEARPLRLEYVEVVDPVFVQPVDKVSGAVRIAAAAWLGSTRLIDNLEAVPGRE